MGWVKIEDRMPWHPKVLGTGGMGFALDAMGLCYARMSNTGGFIPDHALAMLGAMLNACSEQCSSIEVASRLVESGRWIRDDKAGGWHIHDYDEYQPSADAEDDAKKVRKAKAQAAARKRWSKPSRNDAPSIAQADAQAMLKHDPEQCSTDAPLPTPPYPSLEDKEPSSPKASKRNRPTAVPDQQTPFEVAHAATVARWDDPVDAIAAKGFAGEIVKASRKSGIEPDRLVRVAFKILALQGITKLSALTTPARAQVMARIGAVSTLATDARTLEQHWATQARQPGWPRNVGDRLQLLIDTWVTGPTPVAPLVVGQAARTRELLSDVDRAFQALEQREQHPQTDQTGPGTIIDTTALLTLKRA